MVLTDRGDQTRQIGGLRSDLEAGLAKQACHPFAQQDRVVGQNQAHRQPLSKRARMAEPESSSFGMKPRTPLR